jgi:hypothetical protein
MKKAPDEISFSCWSVGKEDRPLVFSAAMAAFVRDVFAA